MVSYESGLPDCRGQRWTGNSWAKPERQSQHRRQGGFWQVSSQRARHVRTLRHARVGAGDPGDTSQVAVRRTGLEAISGRLFLLFICLGKEKSTRQGHSCFHQLNFPFFVACVLSPCSGILTILCAFYAGYTTLDITVWMERKKSWVLLHKDTRHLWTEETATPLWPFTAPYSPLGLSELILRMVTI